MVDNLFHYTMGIVPPRKGLITWRIKYTTRPGEWLVFGKCHTLCSTSTCL